jgi:hypothetical protein
VGEIQASSHAVIWVLSALGLLHFTFLWWVVRRVRAQGAELVEHREELKRLKNKDKQLVERISDYAASSITTISGVAPKRQARR